MKTQLVITINHRSHSTIHYIRDAIENALEDTGVDYVVERKVIE